MQGIIICVRGLVLSSGVLAISLLLIGNNSVVAQNENKPWGRPYGFDPPPAKEENIKKQEEPPENTIIGPVDDPPPWDRPYGINPELFNSNPYKNNPYDNPRPQQPYNNNNQGGGDSTTKPYGGGGNSNKPYGGGTGGGDYGGGSPPQQPQHERDYDCACDRYLKSYTWKDVELYYQIKFPDFCCQFSFWKLIYDYIDYKKHGFDGSKPKRAADEIAEGLMDEMNLKMKRSPDGEEEMLAYILDNSKYDIMGVSSSGGGSSGAAAAATFTGGGNFNNNNNRNRNRNPYGGGGYGYKPAIPCYGLYGRDYLVCHFKLAFKEAVQACYCYYRSTLKCSEDDCNKDIYIDTKVAHYRPQTICNQCPSHDDGKNNYDPYQKPDRPYGHGPRHAYGVPDGKPFDKCIGHCLLTHVPRKYYFDHPTIPDGIYREPLPIVGEEGLINP